MRSVFVYLQIEFPEPESSPRDQRAHFESTGKLKCSIQILSGAGGKDRVRLRGYLTEQSQAPRLVASFPVRLGELEGPSR